MLNQIPDQFLCAEIERIIYADKHQGKEGGQNAAVFELEADFCDHPAEQTGKCKYKKGNQNKQKQGTEHDRKRRSGSDPIDNHGRQIYHSRIQGSHQIHRQQARSDDAPDRNRHRQEQIVILGKIKS